MSYRIFCLYASLKGEEPAPWLIAAEDEHAWEGDPERCESAFKKAQAQAEQDGWETREVVLTLDISAVYKAFESPEIPAQVTE